MPEFISNCLKETENGIILNIKLTPNSSKNEILGYTDEYVKIKISAPPNENKANKKLISYISDWLNIAKSNISLISGDKARLKKVLIKNIIREDLIQKICIYDKIIT